MELKQLGITSATASARDLFAHKDLGQYNSAFHAVVNPDGIVMVKLTPITD